MGKAPEIEGALGCFRCWIVLWLAFVGLHYALCYSKFFSCVDVTRLTVRPSRQWKWNHFGVDLHQTRVHEHIPEPRSDSQVIPIFQGPHVLGAPFPEGMLIGEGAVVGLCVEVYLDHLDPTPGFQHSARPQALADGSMVEGSRL